MTRRHDKPKHQPSLREIADLAERLDKDAIRLERATRELVCRVEPVEDLEERFVRGWEPDPASSITDRQLRDILYAAVKRAEWAMADIRLAAATLGEIAGDVESRSNWHEWIKSKDQSS